MNPKFKEGEIIILQSTTHPQFNGEYPVLGVYKLNTKDKTVHRPDLGVKLQFKSLTTDFVYDLGNFLNAKYCTLNNEFELKKRHDKGDMSFNSLMNSLKSPAPSNVLDS